MGIDKPFGKSAISVEEARRLVTAELSCVEEEIVALQDAPGRISATSIKALTTSPPFDVSAMDGYAVNAANVPAPGVILPVTGVSKAGIPAVPVLAADTCMRIFTGAPVPAGANAIVIQEDADANDEQIRFRAKAEHGLYVRKAGLNFETGAEIIRQGRVLTARDIGLLAAAGHSQVSVRRRPRIAVLSTGDELAGGFEAAGPGSIFDANRPALIALVRAWGGEPVDLGIAGDNDDAIKTALTGLQADLLLIAGGVSVGDYDRVRPVLQALGLSFNFWKIRMKPGKPLMFGMLGKIPVLGLPGNPVSALVCALLFLQPAICALTGRDPTGPTFENARLSAPIGKTGERDDYLRALVTSNHEGLSVEAFPKQDSSMLAMFSAANALLFRPAGAAPATKGEMVKIIRLDNVVGF